MSDEKRRLYELTGMVLTVPSESWPDLPRVVARDIAEQAIAEVEQLEAQLADRDRQWSDALWSENPEGAGPCTPKEAKDYIKTVMVYERNRLAAKIRRFPQSQWWKRFCNVGQYGARKASMHVLRLLGEARTSRTNPPRAPSLPSSPVYLERSFRSRKRRPSA